MVAFADDIDDAEFQSVVLDALDNDLWEKAAADPALVPVLVEETLRQNSPVRNAT